MCGVGERWWASHGRWRFPRWTCSSRGILSAPAATMGPGRMPVFDMSAFFLAAPQVPRDAVVLLGVIFVVVALGAWWVRSRRKPARRLPSQTDVDDFARIFRL